MDPGELGPRNAELTRAGSRAQRELVVCQCVAGAHNDVPSRAVDRLHVRVEKLDSLLGVEVRTADGDLVEGGFPGEIRLRQWRALVGHRGLLADEDDLTAPPVLP